MRAGRRRRLASAWVWLALVAVAISATRLSPTARSSSAHASYYRPPLPAPNLGTLSLLSPVVSATPHTLVGGHFAAAPADRNNATAIRGRPGVRVCEQDGCQLVAKFGDPAGGGPVNCRAHKALHHRLLHGWTPCLHAEGCQQKASFGLRSGRYGLCCFVALVCARYFACWYVFTSHTCSRRHYTWSRRHFSMLVSLVKSMIL